ncbi:DMT family transporter [Bacillus sp. NPDC094106]|uniref:DMT family transporter n=1 Tax=Bacillus sp. NPDC094106 TaxID=3363949 RepID=UPI0038017B44
MTKFQKGATYAIISAFGFGVMPIFAVKAYQYGITVNTLLLLRFFLSTVIFFCYFLFKKTKINLQKTEIKTLFLLGSVLFTLISVFHFESVKYIPSSMAVLLLFLFPIFVSILSYFLYKERIESKAFGALILAFIGISFLLGVALQDSNFYGIGLAIGAAIVYAFYMIVGKKVTNVISPAVTSAYVTLFATIGVFTIGVFSRSIRFDFEPMAWVYILAIVLFSTVLAEITLFQALKRLSSTNVSIISMIEPVFTAIFASFLLHENVTFPQILGGLVVLFSLTCFIYFQREVSKDSTNLKEELFEKNKQIGGREL